MEFTLNGTWTLYSQKLGDRQSPRENCIEAIVPGDVRLDLLRNGLIAEPLTGENSLSQTWIEEQDWWYHKDFCIDRNLLRSRTELVFEGIDQTGDIFINGKAVGHTNNMFRTYRYDVTDLLHEGTNSIDVRVDVGLAAHENAPTKDFEVCWNNWDVRRFWARKSQQSFYWDIAPRLLTCGLWRDVYLESFDEAAVRDVYITHQVQGSTAQLFVCTETEAFASREGLTLSVLISDGKTQTAQSRTFSAVKDEKQEIHFTLELNPVHLWWPNEMGEQHLYHVEINLMDERGRVISSKHLRYGVRDVTILQETINDEESTFNIVVNGIPVFCKGGDWVPPDSIYARITAEQEKEWILSAAECHFNMLRVWGGGIYPSRAFYDACDEQGILVWQDFMFACGYYPDFDEDFCKEFRAEAEDVVRALRNHACLALWCANNENQQVHEMVNPRGTHIGQRLYDNLLPALLEKLDPKNPYWPGSPLGGDWSNSCKRGDQHIWDYSMAWLTNGTRQLRIWDFAEENPKFTSEFGIESPPNLLSARDYMNSRDPDRSSHMWYHHMCYFATGLIENLLKKYYKKEEISNWSEYTLAGQMIQAEAVKDVIETHRARKFICGGVLYWQYAESWGHTGYSPIDYYMRKKSCYYYMRRAFAPLAILFEEKGFDIALVNDTRETHCVQIEYGVMRFDGQILFRREEEHLLGGNANIHIRSDISADIASPETAFAYAVMREGSRIITRNRRFLVPLIDVKLPPDHIRTDCCPIRQDLWQLTLSADTFQWDVNLELDDRYAYSDNAFDIWPGESVSVLITHKTPGVFTLPEIISINTYR